MSFGRLVISKHKHYHVWNYDNIQKVKKDEDKLKADQEKEANRKLDIERERRYSELKDKQQLNNNNNNSNKRKRENEEDENEQQHEIQRYSNNQSKHQQEDDIGPQPQISENKHMNFFENEEKNLKELERLQVPKEAFDKPDEEKDIYAKNRELKQKGLIPKQYFGGEDVKNKKWYEDNAKANVQQQQQTFKQDTKKRKMDPLNDMNKFLGIKKAVEQQNEQKEKKKHQKKTVEDLRNERLLREQLERDKISAILSGKQK